MDRHELSSEGFLRASNVKHQNKLGKGIHKRSQFRGGRAMVGTRLTAQQVAKLECLIGHYTQTTGIQATASSVIAELIDKAGL
jgi:hypothetical protein